MHCSRTGLGGTLAVWQGALVKTIDFHRGRVVFARSTNPDDRLGEFLLRRGTISLRHYLESSAGIQPGKRQGTVLCELGAILPAELVRCVTDQVTEILYTLFPWTGGEYEVRRAEHDTQERIVLAISIEDVIVHGMRRVLDWNRIWRGIGSSLGTVFRPTKEADGFIYRATLEPDESHVLSLVSSKTDVAHLLDVSFASNFETCRILWALRLAGAIEPVPSDAAGAAYVEDYALADSVEAYDRVFGFIFGFVGERIGDLVEHFMDRAGQLAAARHPEALAEVHLRNQGRVEYEQLLANLSSLPPDERRVRAHGALEEVLRVLVELTAKELGPDEESFLRDQLDLLAAETPLVPVKRVLQAAEERGREPASPLEAPPGGPYNHGA